MTQPRLLGGRYELDGVVGRGGMAEVYRARDIRLDRIVAIKTLRSDLARDPTFQARFRREAQSAASLNHPSIIAVYDTGEDMMDATPVPYIVMEFVDGRTLRDLLRADRRLMPERAMELVDGILRALDYSHRGGIVHRDIKPANIMLTLNGEVKVMDFGIARAMADSAATMTQTAQVIGTAQYLSPEQARGERVDARSDIYSTGCVLYELLTGQPPFTGDSPVAIAYQHVREEPIPPSRIDAEIPKWADAIVLKAMAKDPGQRYQSAGEMRGDIQRVMSGMPVDPQTMAMAANNGAYGGGDRTRTMAMSPGAAPAPSTRAIPQYEYGPEEGGGRHDGRRPGGNTALRTAAWILIPVLIIGAFIGVGWKFLSGGGSGSEAKIKVPTMTGQTKEAAEKTLTGLGLKFTETEEFSADVEKGLVIETDPVADTEVEAGSSVTLKISKGPETVEIPNVLGKSPEEAKAELEALEFKVLTVPTVSSRPQNQVYDTKPKIGKDVPKGSTVRIYVPKEALEVPNVTGQTYEDAKSSLEGAGFKVRRSEQANDQPAGTVIGQTPRGGTKLQPGTTITLVVSTGPAAPPEDSDPLPTEDPGSDPGTGDPGTGGEDSGGSIGDDGLGDEDF
jgi:beta-lactam-binding protein with PASTA domain/tRNA A-37 threonylcarbamoyl transferase component Bud32